MGIQLGSAYGKIEIDASGVQKGVGVALKSFETLQTKVAAVGQAMQQLGGAMSAMITVPLALAGRSALSTFAEYEKSMNILGSVSNATAEEMKQLADLAKQLGADLTLPGTSAADAAQAMAELAKAGLSVNEIMAATRGVLQMSAAGQLSNAEAAEIAANALNVFKLSGDEAVRVADLLAAGANSSSAEVREMADSLQMAGSVFAMAGMNIEDLVTSIGLMANSGIQGSDAGTSLKQMLMSLQAQSKPAREEMEKFGISVYDSAGNMLPMLEIIEEFSSKLKNATQEERNHALAVIFGSDAVRAANIVLLGGVDAYEKMYVSVNKVGSAADLAAAMMKGMTGATENLKSAFETASIAAIEPFKENIASILEVMAKVLNAFANLPEPIRKIIVIWLAFIAVIGPVLLFLGTLLSIAGSIVTTFTALGISVGAVGSFLVAAGGALAGFSAVAIAALGSILLLATGPVLLYLAYKNNFMGIATTVKQLWEIIKFYFGQISKRITDAFKSIPWVQIGKNMLSALANGMLMGIPGLIIVATKAAASALAAIKDKLGIHSPSVEFMKLGQFSGQGFQAGLAHAMDPTMISRIMAKPVSSMSSSTQQNITLQLSNGLTMRQAQSMIAQNNEMLLKTIDRAFSGH